MVEPLNPYAPPSAEADYDPSGGFRAPNGGTLASAGTRWLGVFIDQMIMLLALVPGVVVAAVSSFRQRAGEEDVLMAMGFGVIALGFVSVMAVQAILISTSGQSMGKKLLGTKIVRQDGSPPGFVHGVLIRSWVCGVIGAVPGIGAFFSLVDCVFVFRSDRRMLHDLMADTSVIHALKGEGTPWAPPQRL